MTICCGCCCCCYYSWSLAAVISISILLQCNQLTFFLARVGLFWLVGVTNRNERVHNLFLCTSAGSWLAADRAIPSCASAHLGLDDDCTLRDSGHHATHGCNKALVLAVSSAAALPLSKPFMCQLRWHPMVTKTTYCGTCNHSFNLRS